MAGQPKLLDGIEAFHAGYRKGRVNRPPDEYMDTILVPAILHTTTEQFHARSYAIQERTRRMLMYYIAGGWAGNPGIVKSDHAEL